MDAILYLIRLMKIFIFVRQGCCLCDSLKNKIAKINLKEILPNLELIEIDIDRVDLYQDKYKKYDYEVPIIAIEGINSKEIIELPRISPRLKDDQLKNWFEKNINTILDK